MLGTCKFRLVHGMHIYKICETLNLIIFKEQRTLNT